MPPRIAWVGLPRRHWRRFQSRRVVAAGITAQHHEARQRRRTILKVQRAIVTTDAAEELADRHWVTARYKQASASRPQITAAIRNR